MVTKQKRHEFIEVYRQGVEDWRSKGNLIREMKSLSSLLMNYLAITVVECRNSAEAISWCSKHGLSYTLERYTEVMQLLACKADSGEVPVSTIAGNYPLLVFTHVAWAIDSNDLGENLASLASRKDVSELSTPFWQEYSKGVDSLIRGHQYTVGELELVGQELYWVTYLHLIESASKKQDISSSVAAVDDAFLRRNSDKKIKDDAHEIEGAGAHPTTWDFRRDGLLKYIQRC